MPILRRLIRMCGCQATEDAEDPRSAAHALERAQLEWAMEQYRNVRAEVLQSQDSQHKTIQWTLAAVGAVVAGLVVIHDKTGRTPGPGDRDLELFLLGVVLPGFLLLSSLTWLGEVRRMLRAGLHLRYLEELIEDRRQRHAGSIGLAPMPVLGYETALSQPRQIGGRNFEGYVGSLGIYIGGMVGSLVVYLASGLTSPHWYLNGALIGSYIVADVAVTTLITLRRVLPLALQTAHSAP